MHEFSVCQALVTEVERIAASRGALKVETVRLRIGPLSGIVPPLLEHAYPFVCAGTLAEGSTLAIESAPLRVCCEACGTESEAEPNLLTCRACGSDLTRVVSGDDLTLMSIELITA